MSYEKRANDICAKWAEAARIGTLYAGESVILSSLIAAALREEGERTLDSAIEELECYASKLGSQNDIFMVNRCIGRIRSLKDKREG